MNPWRRLAVWLAIGAALMLIAWWWFLKSVITPAIEPHRAAKPAMPASISSPTN